MTNGNWWPIRVNQLNYFIINSHFYEGTVSYEPRWVRYGTVLKYAWMDVVGY